MALAFVTLAGCDETTGPTECPVKEFYIVGDYQYSNGSPTFILNTAETSKEVRINPSDFTLVHSGNLITLTVKNISVFDGEKNYKIEHDTNVRVQQRIGENWIDDKEFDSKRTPLTQIAVALVLDVSKSLGSDFEKVKSFAAAFVDSIKNNTSAGTKIGVVVFSTDVKTMPLSTDAATARTFISGQQVGDFTALYKAMQAGIQMLNTPSVASSARSMLTFSDGADNYSGSVTRDMIEQAISTSRVRSFTVGLRGKGNLDEEGLRKLASSASYEFADSPDDIGAIFTKFAKSITEVYDLAWIRNDQPVSTTKIRFVIKSREKC